ncbi:class I SAM-dependent methyltransferase [Streptomyces smyrnaeus]|uniref:class I SAM-dependent methyltransferase n=1 Tax=Streptomyces smyrnaeus TaxID=1387713 RepID=UPI00368250AD
MYRHAQIEDGDNVLDVGTGSGSGTAPLARRLTPEQVTSVDTDPYPIEAARGRLAHIGMAPTLIEADATGTPPADAD